MASISVPCPKTTLVARNSKQPMQRAINPFVGGSVVNLKPSLSFGSSYSCLQLSNKRQVTVQEVKAQLKEVTTENLKNSALDGKSKVASSETKEESNVPDAASISAFMSEASELIKLVNTRDIVELELKKSGCELVIRKKEALQHSQAAAAPVYAVQPPYPQALPAPAAAPTPAPPAALPSPAKASSSSHPPMKCPMAGTFYQCPAPGAPPFVKVGDKVQKGQVVCIIEAMKLMNEIEADQSGTIVEILAENGKPVSLDTPLFVIAP